jgi:hypothetical protein
MQSLSHLETAECVRYVPSALLIDDQVIAALAPRIERVGMLTTVGLSR